MYRNRYLYDTSNSLTMASTDCDRDSEMGNKDQETPPSRVTGGDLENVARLQLLLETIPAEQKYSIQCQWLEAVLNLHNQTGESVEEAYDHILRSRNWEGVVTEEEFKKRWAPHVAPILSVRNKTLEATTNILKVWPTAEDWIADSNFTASTLSALRQLASTCSFSEGAARLNVAMVQRLRTHKKGIRKAKVVLRGDVSVARIMDANHVLEVRDLELKQLGLKVGPWGVLQDQDDPVPRMYQG